MPTATESETLESILIIFMNVCIFKLLEFAIYFHFSSSAEFTWLQKKKKKTYFSLHGT